MPTASLTASLDGRARAGDKRERRAAPAPTGTSLWGGSLRPLRIVNPHGSHRGWVGARRRGPRRGWAPCACRVLSVPGDSLSLGSRSAPRKTLGRARYPRQRWRRPGVFPRPGRGQRQRPAPVDRSTSTTGAASGRPRRIRGGERGFGQQLVPKSLADLAIAQPSSSPLVAAPFLRQALAPGISPGISVTKSRGFGGRKCDPSGSSAARVIASNRDSNKDIAPSPSEVERWISWPGQSPGKPPLEGVLLPCRTKPRLSPQLVDLDRG